MNHAGSQARFLMLAAGVAVVCLLSACGGAPRIEDFTATMPEDVPVVEAGNGAIFQSGRDVQLFENAVARRVGDTVTINLQESTAAQKSASAVESVALAPSSSLRANCWLRVRWTADPRPKFRNPR